MMSIGPLDPVAPGPGRPRRSCRWRTAARSAGPGCRRCPGPRRCRTRRNGPARAAIAGGGQGRRNENNMNILKEIPIEYRKKKVVRHGRDGHKIGKYERARIQRDTEQYLKERFDFVPIEKETTAVKTVFIRARTNKLIEPLFNRYEELDHELNTFIEQWVKSGLFVKQPLTISEITEWSNNAVAKRIKKILTDRCSYLSGTFRIAEHELCLIVEYYK